jgi:transposase
MLSIGYPRFSTTLTDATHLWADTAYQGLKTWLLATLGWTLTVTKHWWTGRSGFWAAPGQQPPKIPPGFHVMPRRWVVERFFAWFGRNRRLSKDYERPWCTNHPEIGWQSGGAWGTETTRLLRSLHAAQSERPSPPQIPEGSLPGRQLADV